MPQIIIGRPPRTSRAMASADVGPNADVTIIDGGTVVDVQNSESVRVVVTSGTTEIYTGPEATEKA